MPANCLADVDVVMLAGAQDTLSRSLLAGPLHLVTADTNDAVTSCCENVAGYPSSNYISAGIYFVFI